MPHGQGPVRVLVVDDDPETAEMAATFIQRGHDRLVASAEHDPTNVLGRLDAGEFHGVISAYAMTGVDGLDLLTTVRDAYPELPFIIFTANGSEDVASEAISAGVTDYVRKRAGGGQYAELAEKVVTLVEDRPDATRASRAPPG